MQPYRPLPEQIAEQLAAGRTMIVELDAWYLPDTAATSYRARARQDDDRRPRRSTARRERLRYFHNAGLYELERRGLPRLLPARRPARPALLPPYTELVRFDAGRAADRARRCATRRATLLRRHLALRPAANPFVRFGAALERDLPALLEGDPPHYHAYAFATVRMVGSGFELLADAASTWCWATDARRGRGRRDGRDRRRLQVAVLEAGPAPGVRPGPVIDALAAAWERATGGLDAALA